MEKDNLITSIAGINPCQSLMLVRISLKADSVAVDLAGRGAQRLSEKLRVRHDTEILVFVQMTY